MAAPINSPSAAGTSASAPFQGTEEPAVGLPEFMPERVKRGRIMLLEDARYEASADLQVGCAPPHVAAAASASPGTSPWSPP